MDLKKYQEVFIPTLREILDRKAVKTVKDLKNILRNDLSERFGDSYLTVLTKYKQIKKDENGILKLNTEFDIKTQKAFHSLAERINREDYTDGEKANFEEKVAIMRALCILDYTYKKKFERNSVDRNDVTRILDKAIEELKLATKKYLK